MQVIALCGYAGSGKDTAAEALIEQGWQRVSFADPIREMLLAINPYVQVPRKRHWLSWFENWLCGPYICTPVGMALWWDAGGSWDRLKQISPDIRGLLQRIGTEAGREILGEYVWVDIAYTKIWEAKQAGCPGVVVTDLRFANEHETVRDPEGIRDFQSTIIRISRPGVGPVNDHESDQHLAGFEVDHELVNDGDKEQLWASIRAIAKGGE